MLRRLIRHEGEVPRSVVVDVLERLWQTKLSTIVLMERWLSETADTEIRAGLTVQLADERRHARLVGEQIRRLGGRLNGQTQKDGLTRVFDQARADKDDAHRLFALYRGVKAFTIGRSTQLGSCVDAEVAVMLERIVRDEQLQLRWADLRIQRLLTYENMRDCNLLEGTVRSQLESAWDRAWRHLIRGLPRRRHA